MLSTSDKASLIEELDSRVVAFGFFVVKILSPVRKLAIVELGNMEVGSFDLGFVSPSLRGLGLGPMEDLKMESVNPYSQFSLDLRFRPPSFVPDAFVL